MIEKLRHRLAGVRRHQFGSRSESLDRLELTLEEEERAAATEPEKPASKDDVVEPRTRRPKCKPLPSHLPRDEQVLLPGETRGTWGGATPPAAWYRFSRDRKGAHPRDHLRNFRGWMYADGYAGFADLYQSCAINEVARMTHIRRKFVNVHKTRGSAIAEEAITRIAALYGIEKAIRGETPRARRQVREDKAEPLFDDLQAWLAARFSKISGKTPLAAAIRYALTRMKRLRPYLGNGIPEIDNNPAERAMRCGALGRKNDLSMGSERGGQAAAIAYTLIETAKLNSTDPQAWLTAVPEPGSADIATGLATPQSCASPNAYPESLKR